MHSSVTSLVRDDISASGTEEEEEELPLPEWAVADVWWPSPGIRLVVL
jgi:hypothetical protein